jgi:hypothetical protein
MELRGAAQRANLASFARYWNTREALRKKSQQWLPILQQQALKQQMQNHQQSMNIMLKVNAQANALSRIGAAGVAEAAMSDPGTYIDTPPFHFLESFEYLLLGKLTSSRCQIWKLSGESNCDTRSIGHLR